MSKEDTVDDWIAGITDLTESTKPVLSILYDWLVDILGVDFNYSIGSIAILCNNTEISLLDTSIYAYGTTPVIEIHCSHPEKYGGYIKRTCNDFSPLIKLEPEVGDVEWCLHYGQQRTFGTLDKLLVKMGNYLA